MIDIKRDAGEGRRTRIDLVRLYIAVDGERQKIVHLQIGHQSGNRRGALS